MTEPRTAVGGIDADPTQQTRGREIEWQRRFAALTLAARRGDAHRPRPDPAPLLRARAVDGRRPHRAVALKLALAPLRAAEARAAFERLLTANPQSSRA